MNKLREEVITDRVKVVVYDGQPPHPQRKHWLVLVDGKAVWHMTSNLGGGSDMLPLALFIARKEASYLYGPSNSH